MISRNSRSPDVEVLLYIEEVALLTNMEESDYDEDPIVLNNQIKVCQFKLSMKAGA